MVRGCSDGKQKRVKEASRLQLSNRRKHVYLLPSIHVVARSKLTLLCNWKISFATEQQQQKESVEYDVSHDLHLCPTSLLITGFRETGFLPTRVSANVNDTPTPPQLPPHPPHPSYPRPNPTKQTRRPSPGGDGLTKRVAC